MQNFQKDLEVALQGTPIIYVPHFDYELIDKEIAQSVKNIGLGLDSIAEYDINRGIIDFDKKRPKAGHEYAEYKQLDAWLECIVDAEKTEEEKVFLFKNLQQDVLDNYKIQSLLQTFAAKYKHGDYSAKGPVYSIVIVSPMPISGLASGIEKVFTMLDYPLPTAEEINVRISSLPVGGSVLRRGKTKEQFYEELTYALLGLQMYEVEQIIRIILLRCNGTLNRNSITDALREKQRIVKKSGIIEVIETDITLDEVGGLERLKTDLRKKALLYQNLNEIQNKNGFNLSIPKGVLIIGMPGCGKTMIAKAIAKEFGVSLLRLDVNRLMGQYVGMSEENLRRALQTAETAHPCVLWIDEVEKAFAGAGAGGGDSDMLVQRLMGQFLTWMQERKTAVYIVATANDVMRPEFMRKGRFDEVYFVDFPNFEERKSILMSRMKRYGFLNGTKGMYDFSEFISNGQENDKFIKIVDIMTADGKKDTKVDGQFSTGFSGAEIESVVNQVMEDAYVRYRQSVSDNNPIPIPIKITYSEFEKIINDMRGSIMANQVVLEKDKRNNPRKTTNIERIREMQKIYKFTSATL